jgi:hypothetical protein
VPAVAPSSGELLSLVNPSLGARGLGRIEGTEIYACTMGPAKDATEKNRAEALRSP